MTPLEARHLIERGYREVLPGKFASGPATVMLAPKPAVMEAVRKVEVEMRRRIKRNDVPVKGWKLAANDEGDAKVA